MPLPSARISIGEVYTSRPGYASPEVEEALRELTGLDAERTGIYPLAGPNDLIQILADVDGWILIGKAVVGAYGIKWVQELAGSHYKKLAPKIAEVPAAFKKLVGGLIKESDAGNTVSIGFIEPTLDPIQRSDRVELKEFEADDLARKLLIFANCAAPLSAWLNEETLAAQKEGRRPQLTLTITPDGTLIAVIRKDVKRTKIFGGDGSLLTDQIEPNS